MDTRRVLADSSLFIEHLRARDKSATRLFHVTRETKVETCSIVAAEIFYGARQQEAEDQVGSVLEPYPIHPFTIPMAVRVSGIVRELCKKNRLQDLRDVMIAATALELGLSVATLNHNHFAHVPGLKLIKLPGGKK